MIRNRYTAAITDKPWWLAGGIDPSACVAAYQPVGASSLAASYVNLANPGTYNATLGTAPAFSGETGWQFDGGTSKRYLRTGIVPLSTYSMLARFSNAVTNNIFRSVCGAYQIDKRYYFYSSYTDGKHYYGYGTAYSATPNLSQGVMANCAGDGYLNGVYEGSTAGGTMPEVEIYIGGVNNNGSLGGYFDGNIQAIVIYKVKLTAYITAELTRAMNAL